MTKPALPAPAKGGRDSSRNARLGLLYGLGAYTMWGFIPLYFRAVGHVAPLLVLCHRIFWSAVFMGVVVSARREWAPILPVLRSRRNVLLLCAGALLIALNWLLFIYAVSTRQLLQASLGYFINPLLSVMLGMLFLKERLRGWQWLAVGLAVFGVLNLALRGHGFPWLAVSLAGSFGFYGLVRKKVDVNSLHGLLLESIFLLPGSFSIGLLLPGGGFGPGTWGLLALSGVFTAVPLLLFGGAVRRLSLSALGFLQYIGPTLQFVVALCIFGEPLDPSKFGSFVLCWAAIAVYVVDSVRRHRPPAVADEPD